MILGKIDKLRRLPAGTLFIEDGCRLVYLKTADVDDKGRSVCYRLTTGERYNPECYGAETKEGFDAIDVQVIEMLTNPDVINHIDGSVIDNLRDRKIAELRDCKGIDPGIFMRDAVDGYLFANAGRRGLGFGVNDLKGSGPFTIEDLKGYEAELVRLAGAEGAALIYAANGEYEADLHNNMIEKLDAAGKKILIVGGNPSINHAISKEAVLSMKAKIEPKLSVKDSFRMIGATNNRSQRRNKKPYGCDDSDSKYDKEQKKLRSKHYRK